MADPSVGGPIPPDPNLTDAATNYNDLDALPIPPFDPAIFSDAFMSDLGGPFDGDVEDLDFTFDDLNLPSDTEEFLNSFPSSTDLLQFSIDPTPNVCEGFNSGRADQISGDQSSSGAGVLNSQVSGDRSSDVANFLNASSTEYSQVSSYEGLDAARALSYPSPESKNQDREVSGPASSQGSGNSGSAVSETLDYPSPDSDNCARSAASSPKFANNSISGDVDQEIKLEEESNNCLLKRKKESDDVINESRTSKYRRASTVDNANPSNGLNAIGEEEDKRKARLMRNRESAQLSRQRKKHYVEELEDKVRAMHSTIHDLNAKISYIMAENASLRQQLGGGAVCPPHMPPGMYPHPPMAPMGYPWMACPPYVVKPQGSQVPLVPIPRMKPQQPAPAPKAKKGESNKNEGKGKTKKVASVTFLGFLFFILFFGMVPVVNVKFGGMQGTVTGGLDYLGNGFYEQNRGMVLSVNGHLNVSEKNVGMGLSNERFPTGTNFTHTMLCGRDHVGVPESNEFVGSGNSSEALVASLYVPRNDKLVKIDGNLIIHSVLASEKAKASIQDQGTKTSDKTGLAVAGNVPSAITRRNNGRQPRLYRRPTERQKALGSGSSDTDNLKSTASDGRLQQWFREGLAGPMLSSDMCTEVFQFDVSAGPGAIVPATSVANVSVEHSQNATQLAKGRNRRILPGAPIPLPGSRNNVTKEQARRNPDKDNFQGNNSHSSMVVSVLVDPREAGDIEGDGVMGPKSLSRIFVVVLIDSVKYVTYSCILPLKGSVAHLVTA